MSETLGREELAVELSRLPEWQVVDGEMVRELQLGDFKLAMTFVNRVAFLAEIAGHHPDIDIRYNRVKLALVTHDAGGITRQDVDMAMQIEGVAAE